MTAVELEAELERDDGKRSRRVAFSSLVGMALRLLQTIGAFLTMPLVLQALGSERFGVWGSAASFSWMTAFADFGVGFALVTIVARNFALRDFAELRAQIAAAIAVTLLLTASGLSLSVLLIPRFASPNVADAYLIAAALLAVNIPLSLSSNIWCGLQRFHVACAWECFQIISTLCVYFILTRVTTDVRWYIAATGGGIVVANFLSMAHLATRRPEIMPSIEWPSVDRCRRLLSLGSPYLVLALAATLSANLDCVVALSQLGEAAATRMAIAQRVCLAAVGLLGIGVQPLWPAFADAAARGDSAWMRRALFGAAATMAACAATGGAILVLYGQPLLDLWMGGGVQLGQAAFWVMAIWIALFSLGRIVDVLLNGLGKVWFQAKVAIAYSVLAFGLKFVFVGPFGVAGLLGATSFAWLVVTMPAFLWWLARWLKGQPKTS